MEKFRKKWSNPPLFELVLPPHSFSCGLHSTFKQDRILLLCSHFSIFYCFWDITVFVFCHFCSSSKFIMGVYSGMFSRLEWVMSSLEWRSRETTNYRKWLKTPNKENQGNGNMFMVTQHVFKAESRMKKPKNEKSFLRGTEALKGNDNFFFFLLFASLLSSR